MRRRNTDWEYAQASSHTDWDAEGDLDQLRSAMDLRATDPQGAFKALLDLAEAGSVVAMVDVGENYFWERRAAHDLAQAEMWLKRAYERGSLRALLSYGTMLMWEGDVAAAEVVFRKGADQGFAPAIYRLAKMRLDPTSGEKAREDGRLLLEKAAFMGHPLARWRLGRAMALGRFGVYRVPRGLRMLLDYALETLAALELQKKELGRETASGETLH